MFCFHLNLCRYTQDWARVGRFTALHVGEDGAIRKAEAEDGASAALVGTMRTVVGIQVCESSWQFDWVEGLGVCSAGGLIGWQAELATS
jgi:hypothetical protein